MIIQGQVGPITSTTSIAAGTQATARMGQLGELVMSELHGRYYEQGYRRNLFSAANPTGVTSTAVTSGTTTNITGIILANPVGTTVNLVLLKAGYTISVAPAAIMPMFLAVGYNSSTNLSGNTSLTVRNNFVGVGAAGQGVVYSASTTIPTAPNFVTTLGSVFTTISSNGPTVIDMEGAIVLPPGGYALITSTVASGASGFFGSFMWEEVPV
jgi:hypothetical protein